jgi:hypothetical protein
VIFFWDGLRYPFTVQEGDVLFVAGRLPVDRKQRLPFEHVALAAESLIVASDEDLLNLRVYGLPESVELADKTLPLQQNSGRFWLKEILNEGRIGSPSTVWNLGGRVGSVTPRKARYFGELLSFLEGTIRFRFHGTFAVDPTLTRNIKTNCMGLVCSFFEYFGLIILKHRLPKYPSPYDYSPAERNFPSPGHLARALKIHQKNYPYGPKTKREAERYSRADVTLEKAARKRSRRASPK